MSKKYYILLFSAALFINACSYRELFRTSVPAAKSKIEKSTITLPLAVKGMAYIPGGWFNIGSNLKADESPVHRVYVKGFYMDATEVTVAEYRRFCMATNRKMPKQPAWSGENLPVVNVTWLEATTYAQWAGKRLPSEAEWEYAARGASKDVTYSISQQTMYGRSFGNIADESIKRIKYSFPIKERYEDGYPYAAPVASFPANTFGLADMDGNVLEWCADWYDAKYYTNKVQLNPRGPEAGSYRIVRGASWNRSGEYLRATYRTFYTPSCTFEFLGFRCVMDENNSSRINIQTLTSK